MVKVSILVPCYNVEKYVKQCLESLKNQTLRDIEIICINDGSTDATLDIIQDYVAQDNRFLLINKKNSGYGDSMNQGLEAAKGEYIGIVESDDWVDAEMFETLYRVATENKLEMVRSGYYTNRLNKDIHCETYPEVPKETLIRPVEHVGIFHTAPAIWANLYSRRWLMENEIRFLPTPGASYQDTAFSVKCLVMVKRLMFIENAYLHYRNDNPNSSVHSKKKMFCVCDEWEEIYRYASIKRKEFEPLWHMMPALLYNTFAWNYRRLEEADQPDFIYHWSKVLKRMVKKGELNWFALKKRKRELFLICYFPSLFLKFFHL